MTDTLEYLQTLFGICFFRTEYSVFLDTVFMIHGNLCLTFAIKNVYMITGGLP